MSLRLQVIIASTRPGRVGASVGQWFADYARGHSDFEVELVDLADINLPLYDEPSHPRMQQYQHAHTKRWSETVARADAYVFVTPEYNYSPAPSLVNALDYVYLEWNYKPCSFLSYGGVSGGLRAAQAARLQVTTLKMMPIPEGITVPMVPKQLDDEGKFVSNEAIDHSANSVLDELARWAGALKPLRD